MNIEKIIHTHLNKILLDDDGNTLPDETEIHISRETLEHMIIHCFDLVETTIKLKILERETPNKYLH